MSVCMKRCVWICCMCIFLSIIALCVARHCCLELSVISNLRSQAQQHLQQSHFWMHHCCSVQGLAHNFLCKLDRKNDKISRSTKTIWGQATHTLHYLMALCINHIWVSFFQYAVSSTSTCGYTVLRLGFGPSSQLLIDVGANYYIKITYTLGRGQAYISDMSSTSWYMGAKYFQEFGPRFFDMSSASGYMGATYFQEFALRFSVSCRWNLHYLNASCPSSAFQEPSGSRASATRNSDSLSGACWMVPRSRQTLVPHPSNNGCLPVW